MTTQYIAGSYGTKPCVRTLLRGNSDANNQIIRVPYGRDNREVVSKNLYVICMLSFDGH